MFTKEAAKEAIDAVDDMFSAFSKPKRMEFLGHFNEILLFLEAARAAAPDAKLSPDQA